MRIGDWSSDVCSSDLVGLAGRQFLADGGDVLGWRHGIVPAVEDGDLGAAGVRAVAGAWLEDDLQAGHGPQGDRKCVLEGQEVSLSVDFGGCRLVETKTLRIRDIISKR